MNTSKTIYPGDVITALGQSFTVWNILYQECFDDVYDVEFIDDHDRYHHWKQAYDGGTVTRSGVPGTYYADVNNRDRIACIREARTPGTFNARVLNRSDYEIYLGRFSSVESALARLIRYGEVHSSVWKEMSACHC